MSVRSTWLRPESIEVTRTSRSRGPDTRVRDACSTPPSGTAPKCGTTFDFSATSSRVSAGRWVEILTSTTDLFRNSRRVSHDPHQTGGLDVPPVFCLGAWSVPLGTQLGFDGQQIGLVFGTTAVAAMISAFFCGNGRRPLLCDGADPGHPPWGRSRPLARDKYSDDLSWLVFHAHAVAGGHLRGQIWVVLAVWAFAVLVLFAVAFRDTCST